MANHRFESVKHFDANPPFCGFPVTMQIPRHKTGCTAIPNAKGQRKRNSPLGTFVERDLNGPLMRAKNPVHFHFQSQHVS
jgi:hypothetical protein